MTDISKVFNDLVSRSPSMQLMAAEMEARRRQREAEAAQASPKEHKLSRVFPEGSNLNYHYVEAGHDGYGRRIRFCYSIHRNVAGYFLSWREVWSRAASAGKRDKWSARRQRKAARELAQKRAERYLRARAAQSSSEAGNGPVPAQADSGSARTKE